MSSFYNYELDENYIRSLMLDSEIEISESDWERFEASRKANFHHKSIKQFIPRFQFIIPKNILYPSLFVAIIFGLSAMLFSFVDFKKANSVNIDQVNDGSSISKKNVPSQDLKSNINHVSTINQSKKNIAVQTGEVNQESSKQQASAIQVLDTILDSISDYKLQQNFETPQSIVSPKNEKKIIKSEQKIKSKLLKKNIIHEKLPSINTSSKIIEITNEPELDLK